MGTPSHTRTAILAASVLAFQFRVCAQGSLTPPGAPAATMKSLDQVEARTAITNTSSLVIISQPGSYYLTQNHSSAWADSTAYGFGVGSFTFNTGHTNAFEFYRIRAYRPLGP